MKKHILLIAVILILSGFNITVQADNAGTYNLLVQKDSYVLEESPSTNYGSSTQLVAGRGVEFGYLERTYLRFDHSPIPEDATVSSATLQMRVKSSSTDDYRVRLQKVATFWSESTITWNNQPSASFLTNIASVYIDENDGWVEFNITSTVQAWIDGEANEGLAMRAYNESGDIDDCSFYSSESHGCNPYIYVVYTTNETVPESPDAPICDISSDATPPGVEISFSSDPIQLGESVTVHATGRDPQGIHVVQIYRGSTLICEERDDYSGTTLSTSCTITPENAGTIMFWAVAYNDRMQAVRVLRNLFVQVDGDAPNVTIYHLPVNPDIGESVTFYAEASDPSGIRNFSIEINGTYHRYEPGFVTHVSENLVLSDADVYYDPSVTRIVTYSATAFDEEGYHTTCGTKTVVFGNGTGTDSDEDGLDDEIEDILGLDETSNDTDGDGLYDSWEVLGVDRDGDGSIDLDLPGWGASPHHKDMFVELDWMEDGVHSHKPHPWAIQTAINLYRCYGIRMHADVGGLGGGNAVSHLLNFDGVDKGAYLMDVREANSDRNRLGIFRYVLCGHAWSQCFWSGNMYLVTEPSGYPGELDEPYMQANHLIHEIGHSLNLGHGGQSRSSSLQEKYALGIDFSLVRQDQHSWINTNYKPNYLSIMNYLYSERNGLHARLTDGSDIIVPSFSQNIYRYNDLDENHLNESTGFDFPLDWGMYTWRRRGDTYYKVNDWFEGVYYVYYKNRWIPADGTPIDWDDDGNNSETDVSADINNDGSNGTLTFENDVNNFMLPICTSRTEYLNPANVPQKFYELTVEACDGLDNDNDGMIDEGYPDMDFDGIADFIDNAIHCYNPGQEDLNNNYIGDIAEIPLSKVINLKGTFDTLKMTTHLSWYAPKPAEAILGYNVYRKDRSGVFKRLGGSYPSTLSGQFAESDSFLLDVNDSLTYYVRPVNIYMVEGEKSDVLTFHPSVKTITSIQTNYVDASVKCFPNPFSESTTIAYAQINEGYVNIRVYNLMGQRVSGLMLSHQSVGKHEFVWDGTDVSGNKLPPGTYFCTIQTENYTKTIKLVIGR